MLKFFTATQDEFLKLCVYYSICLATCQIFMTVRGPWWILDPCNFSSCIHTCIWVTCMHQKTLAGGAYSLNPNMHVRWRFHSCDVTLKVLLTYSIAVWHSVEERVFIEHVKHKVTSNYHHLPTFSQKRATASKLKIMSKPIPYHSSQKKTVAILFLRTYL